MSETDVIDFNKLTQKELLIRLHDKVDGVTGEIETIKKKEDARLKEQQAIIINAAKLETKVKVWGAAFGVGSAIAIEVITLIFTLLLK